jgi:hypothetical protein
MYPLGFVLCLLGAVAALAGRRLVLYRRWRAWEQRLFAEFRAGRQPFLPPPLGRCWTGLAVAVAFEAAAVVFLVLWLLHFRA